MRVRLKLAAHSNEFSTVNKDGLSFMNVRAALSCIGKLVFLIKLAQNVECQIISHSILEKNKLEIMIKILRLK